MKFLITAISVFALLAPVAASAAPGNGHGNQGGGKGKNQAAQGVSRDNGNSRGHNAMANGAWTPPGLAKKPYGMPPGQAKKMWNRGERLPDQYFTQTRYYVTNPTNVNLSPAPAGSRWVKVGDNYYLAETQTGAVMQIVSALLR